MRNIMINGTSVSYDRMYDRFKVALESGTVTVPAQSLDWGAEDVYRQAYEWAVDYRRTHPN